MAKDIPWALFFMMHYLEKLHTILSQGRIEMITHIEITQTDLHKRIRRQEIRLGGNRKLKIYGTLQCGSGKKMKRDNRIFFSTESNAIQNGFRPCGHCMKQQYQTWKNGLI